MQPVASGRESRMFDGVSTMLPMRVRNWRQEENIDQVYCNIVGGGRSRVIKLLLPMGVLPNSFCAWKPEMTCCYDSAATADLVQQIQETRLHVGDKRWSVDSMGTLPEQLSTRPETGDHDVLQCLLVQCTRLVCSVLLPDTRLKIRPCIISL